MVLETAAVDLYDEFLGFEHAEPQVVDHEEGMLDESVPRIRLVNVPPDLSETAVDMRRQLAHNPDLAFCVARLP